jgi:hypothetical protein
MKSLSLNGIKSMVENKEHAGEVTLQVISLEEFTPEN